MNSFLVASFVAVASIHQAGFPAKTVAGEPGIERYPIDPVAYDGPAWSPYVVGALIGILSMCTFYFSNRPLGASTAYARMAGLIGIAVAPSHTRSLHLFRDKEPKLSWEVTLICGVVMGAFFAAWHGGELTGRWLPEMWIARFGSESYAMRTLTALAGGVLMAFGARTAGGCTSGHGISGTLQLSVGSWIAAVCIFLGGIAVAIPLFRI